MWLENVISVLIKGGEISVVMKTYKCSKCGKIIYDRDRIFNGSLCGECFVINADNTNTIWSILGFNNIDEILEEKRYGK